MWFVTAIDIDLDGDVDVLSVTKNGATEWFENLDGRGLSWTNHTVSTAYQFSAQVHPLVSPSLS